MSSSCSFRITRTAEDLAQTINSLSQRLVKLENRLEAIELEFQQEVDEPPAEEIKMLDGVDQILRECQELLETSTPTTSSLDVQDESWPPNLEEEDLAA
tara:strand:+ start:292 stop:588 length:297 start_codon:yes stop_codon:yes gene_type:complete